MENIKPVRDDKLLDAEREIIRGGTDCWISGERANHPHHIFFGSDKDDRFIAPLSSKSHGTGYAQAHGSDAGEIQIILVRRWIKMNPDRREEILLYADARGYGDIRERIK